MPSLDHSSFKSALVSRIVLFGGVPCVAEVPARVRTYVLVLAALFVFPPLQSRAAEEVVVRSVSELRPWLGRDRVQVRMRPGTYRLDQVSGPNFMDFSGNHSHYDFTGVKFEVDSAVLGRFKEGLNILLLSGNDLSVVGLTMHTAGTGYAPGGCRAISISGNNVTLSNVSLRLQGSYPYGYGSYFGISGREATINPRKLNGIRIGGLDVQVINCHVVMECFGHAIFVRGGQNALIKDCVVEGVLRKTDEILAEKEGPAFDLGFMQYTGQPIPPGRVTSLSEDGIRAYPDDPEINRRTQNISVVNCQVRRMRRGICLAFAAGTNSVVGCEVTESERVGYHVGPNTTVRDSRGDALYCQVLDISSPTSKGADVELRVMDSRAHYGNDLLAKINGTGHRVVLREAGAGAVPAQMSIELGTDRGFGQGRMESPRASRVRVQNATPAAVVLHPPTEFCTVESIGVIRDLGRSNSLAGKFDRRESR